MAYLEKNYRRRSIRLKNYDYSQPNIYYITLCTQHRLCLFGNILNNKMNLNHAGIMVNKFWRGLSERFNKISLSDYIIMPNHLHGLIKINQEDGAPLPEIIQYFKSITSLEYIQGVKNNIWPQFLGKLWQRNYYEHIIRDESSLNNIKEYIISNPVNWNEDKENPKYLR